MITARKLALMVGTLSVSVLAGCSSSYEVNTDDGHLAHHQRHPIELQSSHQKLEIYSTRPYDLDQRQKVELAEFVRRYRKEAKSVITIRFPQPLGEVDPAVKHVFSDVKRQLASQGISGRHLVETTYPTTQTTAPIVLSYVSLQAGVAHECGLYPSDLAGGPTVRQNEQYWDFGCASQTNFANQIADPLDLVRAHPASTADAGRRSVVMKNYREGAGQPASSDEGSTTASGSN